MNLRETAQFLWRLLDDIDTATDIAGGNDAAYRAMVEKIQRRRFEVSDSDGYNVKFHCDRAPEPIPTSEAFHYEGRVYVRPLGRGISLIDAEDGGDLHLEDALDEGFWRISVIAERLSAEDAKKASEDMR